MTSHQVKRRTTDRYNGGIVRTQQLTISELVASLELCDPEAPVHFSFGLHPLIEPERPFFRYYEGIHDHIAISWTDQGKPPTVWELIEAARPWIGKTIEAAFNDLLIDHNMPLWAGQETNDTAIVGVTENAEYNLVYLQTWAIP